MNTYLNHCGIVCALGANLDEVRHRLLVEERSGLSMTERWSKGRSLPLGVVQSALPSLSHLPLALQSRNNQLALAALDQIRPAITQAIAQYGADRIAIVVGTSTSGISETETALRSQHANNATQNDAHPHWPAEFHYAQQEMGSLASLIASEFKISGPAYAHSSACSSSAKAMASAARLLKMGVVDAVICGGADSLCDFTVAGFSALESVSEKACQPMSADRDGINIGEGAAFFLMTKAASGVAFCGWGESSDGHHMSAPDPSGAGAKIAIKAALERAGISAAEVDYINMHGTATVQNDAMESRVIAELFGSEILVSSSKAFTGHALGAAAAIEAALCWICLQEDNRIGRVPAHLWNGHADTRLPTLNLAPVGAALGRPLRYILSNSFAFGGSNASLILGANIQTDPRKQNSDLDIRSLVPHASRMVLLDRVVNADAESLCAEVKLEQHSLFCEAGLIGAWVGIEYMAQAIAAHAGYLAQEKSEAVKVGFLLGTRRYASHIAHFNVGQILHIRVKALLRSENGLGSYECEIIDSAQPKHILASATITVFQPDNAQEFLGAESLDHATSNAQGPN